MSYPSKNQPQIFGPALLGTILSVIASLVVAAYAASALGDTYEIRVGIYAGLLTWSIIGALSVYFLTREGQTQLTLRTVILYFLSAWFWPFLLLKPLLRLLSK